MLKFFIIYAVLAVYIDESVLNVDAQTAGTAKAPFSKSNDRINLHSMTSFVFKVFFRLFIVQRFL